MPNVFHLSWFWLYKAKKHGELLKRELYYTCMLNVLLCTRDWKLGFKTARIYLHKARCFHALKYVSRYQFPALIRNTARVCPLDQCLVIREVGIGFLYNGNARYLNHQIHTTNFTKSVTIFYHKKQNSFLCLTRTS